MIGIKSLLYSERTGKQLITTRFLVIAGLPIIPYQSYFVHNRMIELGSYKIPLNRKNIIKNYAAVYLSFLGFLLFIFNFFLDENFLLSSHINPYHYYLRNLNWPLGAIEKVITLVTIILSIYFLFVYGMISEEAKVERLLSIKNTFWNTQFPGKNLVPILAEHYEEEEQIILFNQLLILTTRVVVKVTEEENEIVDFSNSEELLDFFDNKLYKFIINREFESKETEYVSLIFLTLNVKKLIDPSDETMELLEIIKTYLLGKIKIE